MKNTKRFSKVASTIVAVYTIACTATVSASALCIKDAFSLGQNTTQTGNNCSVVSIIQCIRNGKCNIFDLFGNKTDCTNGDCEDTTTTTTQVEAVKPTAPTATAPTTTTGTTTTANSNVKAVFDLVNKERKTNGLGALTLSNELCKVADVRAKEIVRSFSHTRPDGASCFTAFKESGITYRAAGENIAAGQKTAAEVMNGWMNSSGHRANILSKNFGKIGIACYTVNGRNYWVQLFTN